MERKQNLKLSHLYKLTPVCYTETTPITPAASSPRPQAHKSWKVGELNSSKEAPMGVEEEAVHAIINPFLATLPQAQAMQCFRLRAHSKLAAEGKQLFGEGECRDSHSGWIILPHSPSPHLYTLP